MIIRQTWIQCVPTLLSNKWEGISRVSKLTRGYDLGVIFDNHLNCADNVSWCYIWKNK